ncbi:intraflagellar transport protein 122 homolog [Dysidea avara]|uniref:intraflagellar transport protein 122 homolog n=1 Tax=Dysidea avara TaxID=196820 RepID=UPI003330B7BF
MRFSRVWITQVTDKTKTGQCLCDVAVRPDGQKLYVASGGKILLYHASNGVFEKAVKAHKETVYCLAILRDGQRMASGGSDKTVIIWSLDLIGLLKFTLGDSIQCMAFNPVTHHLLSCSSVDIGLWYGEQSTVTRHRITSRATCCGWTSDGHYFAIGMFNGSISIRTKNCDEKVKIERPGGQPVWEVSWNPSKDHSDILTVCDWNQKLSFFQPSGRQVGKERTLGYDPCFLDYFLDGEYMLIGGSNKQVSVYTKEGTMLFPVEQQKGNAWVMAAKLTPDQIHIITAAQDGTLIYYDISMSTVHGLHRDRYAYRDHMTDVIVQHLLTDEKVRIKCKDLVKKIAVYKHKLAVQLPDKVVIYEIDSDDPNDMMYHQKEKIPQQFNCSLLVVCSTRIILCQERKLQCFAFNGDLEREWEVESYIRYIKVVGGPVDHEVLLVGLKNGQILSVLVDNPFPSVLLQQQSAIRCLDISANNSKLAVVDENYALLVYDIRTKELLFQEPQATSVTWNNHCDEMLCFSYGGHIHIKASNFPVHTQKHPGFVVGYTGSKIFCLSASSMYTVDVPQSTAMLQYLERKMYKDAYIIACLGVTDNDWRILGLEALEGLDYDTAKKAFIRIRDLRYLELIHSIEERMKQGINDITIFQADIYAYEGKFQEAAKLYKKAGVPSKAVEMYTDLREFDLAKEFMMESDTQDVKQFITKQADWCKTSNDPSAAVAMYTAAGEYPKAVEIMGENGWIDKLVDTIHQLDSSRKEVLLQCAVWLKRLGQYMQAAIVYEKLDDAASLVRLYVEGCHWDEAFNIIKKHPSFKDDVYLPYATWLVENDRFNEAQEALVKGGRQHEALNILRQLADNSITENRFNDTGYYYWLLAKSCLDAANKIPKGSKDSEVEQLISAFKSYYRSAEVYHVFHSIQRFTDQPFTYRHPEALFNMALFLTHLDNKNNSKKYRGVSKVAVLYTLAKQGKVLGAYKVARYAYDQLQTLHVPQRFQEIVDLGAITIQSKPFQDKEDLLPLCYRCSATNPLLKSQGNCCINCKQPFVLSFASFEVLPVVEFFLDSDISDEEAVKLIRSGGPVHKTNDDWKETNTGGAQVLTLERLTTSTVDDSIDPFTNKLLEFEEGGDFFPVTVDRDILKSLPKSEVIIKQWGHRAKNQYYKVLLPEVPIALCKECQQMFHMDDYEMQLLTKKCCPFCRTTVDNTS